LAFIKLRYYQSTNALIDAIQFSISFQSYFDQEHVVSLIA
jgi:hypothetical protein